jgi:redox-sensitive bicupin YhaK (pirin superfamily)
MAFPNKRNVTPRYQQISLNPADRINKFQQILSPNPEDDGVWIHQDAWFHLSKFDKESNVTYDLKRRKWVYAFILSGKVTINGQELETRDGLEFGMYLNFRLKQIRRLKSC